MEKLIVVSGMPGAGSTTVSKILAEKLSLNYFSPGQLFKDISKGKVKEQHYYKLFKTLSDERNLEIPDFNSRNDSDAAINLWETPFGQSQELHEIIDELQLELAKKDNTILDGKLSIHMIPQATLKVWLKSSLDERAKRASKRDGLSQEQTKEIIKSREAKEREEWKKIYGIDYFDQEAQADLIIDSSDLSPQEVAEKIKANL